MTWIYILIGIGAIVLLKQIQYLIEERYEHYRYYSLEKQKRNQQIMSEFTKKSDVELEPLYAFLRNIMNTDDFYSSDDAIRIGRLYKNHIALAEAAEKATGGLSEVVAISNSNELRQMNPLQKLSVMKITAPVGLALSLQSIQLHWAKNDSFFYTISEACSLLLVEKKENPEFQHEVSGILDKAILCMETGRAQLRKTSMFRDRIKILQTVIRGLNIPIITVQYTERLKLAS